MVNEIVCLLFDKGAGTPATQGAKLIKKVSKAHNIFILV
jgi:hypothetical protein